MRSRLKRGDLVICGAVLLLAAALMLFLQRPGGGERLYAEVYQDGKLIERAALHQDTDRTIDVGGHNTVVLRGGSACMYAADCRDQVCVRTGTLTRAGQAAVCVPNRVVLRIVGENGTVDAIAS